MFWNNVQIALNTNYAFLQNTFKHLQLDSSSITVIPSILFLTCSFVLCHRVFHRRTCYHTPVKLFVQREIGFQWTYFYMVRMWLFFVKTSRFAINWLVLYLKVMHCDNKMLWFSPLQLRAGFFSVITSISAVPLTVLIVNCLWKQNIPNFLMWVGEDPWLRSEIGISGHYLDRPIRFQLPRRKEYSYRSRRSSSVDCILNKASVTVVRNCKSMQAVSCVVIP